MIPKVPLPPRPQPLRQRAIAGPPKTENKALAEAMPPPVPDLREDPRERMRRGSHAGVSSDAIWAAIDLARKPVLAKKYRQQPLPAGILRLIRIAASDEGLSQAVDLTGEDPTFLRAATMFYLEEVLWPQGGDHFRALGLPRGAPADRVAENMRWLMKWLHFHVGSGSREAPFADRVMEAWSALKPPASIKELDAAPVSTSPGLSNRPGATRQPQLYRFPRIRTRWRDARWSIALVAAVGLAAVATVVLGARSSGLAGLDSPGLQSDSAAQSGSGVAEAADAHR